MRIAVVGAGTVGTAIAVRWRDAGHTITAVGGRGATRARAARWLPGVGVVPIEDAAGGAEVVVLGVPDDVLPDVVVTVAATIDASTWALHLSGALGLGVLGPIERAGAGVLALHPLQTFADVEGAIDSLGGAAIAVTARDEEGAALGDRLGRDLGGTPFPLADENRALYHAAAVFASNYLVAASGAALDLFAAAGVPDASAAMHPLQAATLANVHRLGPSQALTGPAVRGDAGTIGRNLDAVAAAAPALVPAYVAMCRTAMDVAGPRLSEDGRRAVEAVLARWS
ncbi:MAG: Rossmann-like and DUF2520 domain-containing protein [Actinomycetota bacterium]